MSIRVLLPAAAGLVLIGALTACGSGTSSSSTAPAAVAAAAPSASTVDTDYSNIPGMAMGAPPETSSMNCSSTSCDVVYIPPSTEITKPFGVAVKLVSSNAARVVVTIAGKQLTLEPGKAVHSQGITVTLTGAPGTVVNLHFAKN